MTDTTSLFAEAQAAASGGDFAAAQSIYERILARDPNDRAALLHRALCVARQGRSAEATRFLSQFVDLEPNSVIALTILSKLLRESGQLPAAEGLAERATRLAPRDVEAVYNLGLCYFAGGRYEEAIFFFERSVMLNPRFGAGHYALGSAYETIGQPWPALMAFRASVDIDPLPEGFLKLGQAYLAVGDMERAAEYGRKATELGFDSPAVHLLLADALTDSDPAAAEAHLTAAVAADPASKATFANTRARRLSRAGRLAEAQSLYRESLAQDPRSGSAYLNLVTIERAQVEDEDLVRRMEELAEDRTVAKDERMYLHFGLAKTHADLGRYESAMRHYDAANALSLLVHPYLRKFDRVNFGNRVDALIETYTERFIAENSRGGCPSSRPVFIVGMMRSGTTLMEQVLSRHPKVAAGGELAFWSFSEKKILRPAIRSEPAQIHRANMSAATDAYLRLLETIDANRERVTDKNPANILALGLIAIAFPEAHIIRMTRDPVDTALSIYMTPSRRPPEFGGDRDHIVAAIRHTERLMAHWGRVLRPDRFHSVRYEELVSRPEPVLRGLLDAIGLEWAPDCLQPEHSRALVGTPSVWQVRQPLNTGSVGRSETYRAWLGSFDRLK